MENITILMQENRVLIIMFLCLEKGVHIIIEIKLKSNEIHVVC